MKFIKATLAGVAMLACMAAAQAAPINIGGVVWDPDFPTNGADKDFTARYSFNQWFTGFKDPTTATNGDFLNAAGEFTSWNGVSIDPNSTTGGALASFCPGCELSFEVGGLKVDNTKASGFDFSAGFLNIWVAKGALINYNNSGNPLNIPGASDGVLFLGLSVADLQFTPIGGNGFLNGALTLSLQATSGLAKANFDTNTLGFGFDLGSSASAQFEKIDINGDSLENEWVATATGQVKGNTIPEPASLALVGLGLLGAGLARRRASK